MAPFRVTIAEAPEIPSSDTGADCRISDSAALWRTFRCELDSVRALEQEVSTARVDLHTQEGDPRDVLGLPDDTTAAGWPRGGIRKAPSWFRYQAVSVKSALAEPWGGAADIPPPRAG